MGGQPAQQVTQILGAIHEGDSRAADELLPLLYDELRKLAQHRMASEPAGHTLTATALVHEAYLRLVQDREAEWDSRGHFFAAAAEAMRRILVERARKYAGPKRGGGRRRVAIEDSDLTFDIDPAEMLALDEALDELEQTDPRMQKITKLRYFAGLTVQETAAALGISPRTVNIEWSYARAWLYKRLNGGAPCSEAGGPDHAS